MSEKEKEIESLKSLNLLMREVNAHYKENKHNCNKVYDAFQNNLKIEKNLYKLSLSKSEVDKDRVNLEWEIKVRENVYWYEIREYYINSEKSDVKFPDISQRTMSNHLSKPFKAKPDDYLPDFYSIYLGFMGFNEAIMFNFDINEKNKNKSNNTNDKESLDTDILFDKLSDLIENKTSQNSDEILKEIKTIKNEIQKLINSNTLKEDFDIKLNQILDKILKGLSTNIQNTTNVHNTINVNTTNNTQINTYFQQIKIFIEQEKERFRKELKESVKKNYDHIKKGEFEKELRNKEKKNKKYSLIGSVLIFLTFFYFLNKSEVQQSINSDVTKVKQKPSLAFKSINKDSLQILVLRFYSDEEKYKNARISCPGENIDKEIKAIIKKTINEKDIKGKKKYFPVKCIYRDDIKSPSSMEMANKKATDHNADMIIYGTFDDFKVSCDVGQLCFKTQPSDSLWINANKSDEEVLKLIKTDSLNVATLRKEIQINEDNETHIDVLQLENWVKSVLSSKLGKNNLELFYIDPNLSKEILSQKYYERSKINNINYKQKLNDLVLAYENNPKNIKVLKELCRSPSQNGKEKYKYCDELIKISKSPENYILRGKSKLASFSGYYGFGKNRTSVLKEVKKDFYKALSLAPKRLKTYLSIVGIERADGFYSRDGLSNALDTVATDSLLNKGIDLAKESKSYKELVSLYKGRAYLKLQNKDTLEFFDYINKAIFIAPENTSLYYRLLEVYKKQKKTKLVLKQFNKVIELEATNYKHHTNLGRYYQEKKAFDKAKEQYEKVVELNPSMGYSLLGYLYLAKKEGKQEISIESARLAVSNFTKLINEDTTKYNNYLKRISALKRLSTITKISEKQNILESIKKDYKTYIRLSNYRYGHIQYADFCKENKFYKEALVAYDSVISRHPSQYNLYLKKNEIYRLFNKKDEALRNYDLAIKNGYSDYEKIISFYKKNNDTINEEKYTNKYWEHDYGKKIYLIQKRFIFKSNFINDEEKRKETNRLLKFLKKEKEKTVYYAFLINYYTNNNDEKKSNYYLKKWVKSGVLNFNAVEVFDEKFIVSFFLKSIKKDPENSGFYRNLGEFYKGKNSYSLAFKYFKKNALYAKGSDKQKAIRDLNSMLINQRDTLNGVKWFNDLAKINPAYLHSKYRFFKRVYPFKKNKEKLVILDKCISSDSIQKKELNGDYLIDKTTLLIALNRKNEALKVLEKVKISNTRSLLGWRADIYEELGDLRKSLNELNALVEIDSTYLEARGDFYVRQKKYSLALKDFDGKIKYTKLRKKDINNLYERKINIFIDQQNYKSVISSYSKIIKSNPNSINYYQNRAKYYIADNQLKNSFKDIDSMNQISLRKGKKLHVDYYGFVRDSADSYLKRGRGEKAEMLYTKAIELDSSVKNFESRAKYFLIVNKIDKAFRDIKNSGILHSKKDSVKYNYERVIWDRAWELKREKKWKELINIYSKLIEIDSSANHFFIRAENYFRINDIDNALKDIKKGALLHSEKDSTKYDYYNTYMGLIWDYQNEKKWDKAFQINSKLIEIDSSAGFFINRAELYSKNEEYDLAIDDYDIAHKLSESDKEKVNVLSSKGRALRNKSLLLIKLDSLVESEKVINEAIKLNPNEAYNYYLYSYLLRKKGLYKKSIEHINKAVKLAETIPKYYRLRGNVHYAFKEYDKALKDYDTALKIDSLDMWSNHDKGDALFSLGRYSESFEFYSKAKLKSKSHFYYHNWITWFVSVLILLFLIVFIYRIFRAKRRKFLS